MLGKAVYGYFSQFEDYKIYGISRQSSYFLPNVTLLHGDLGSDEFLHSFSYLSFDAIIHCAAEVNVNLCEINKVWASKSNVESTKNLFSTLKSKKYIYISTDGVFDGRTGNYSEVSTTLPLNYYAETKLLGEKVTRDIVENYYILRTNIYGFNFPMKKSLFEWGYTELKKGNNINGFNNMFFNPMYVGQLAKLIESLVVGQIDFGTYNISTNEKISKYDFLLKIAKTFNFSIDNVHAVAFNQDDFVAPRALNTTLNNTKIKTELKNFDFSFDASFLMLKKDFTIANN